jgi:EAL domain-containing protein (putative c-di-GMP-specific phosphodiesterase class I)
VDDFGTGHSSLAFLQGTAVHELKVDRTLGARSVAEGVEGSDQAAALREMGCDVAQGYWLSKPAPAAGMRALLGLRVTAEARASVSAAREGQQRVLCPVVAEGA